MDADIADPSLIPLMRTDVTLRSPRVTIVVDAKFYSDPFVRSTGAPKFDLAIYNCSPTCASDRSEAPVHGALVYAAPAGGCLHRYRSDGHEVAVAAIDLSKQWTAVHSELINLLHELARPDPVVPVL
jgi:5-methylcytosine-specific restriction enzyme subunit McrC